MAVKNSTILASAQLEGVNDFTEFVDDNGQMNMRAVSEYLFAPMNNQFYSQWSANLINRVGQTIAEKKRFENPLAVFRKPDLNNGLTIQQVAVKWAKGHSYSDHAEDLLKYERPEFVTAYHSINRAQKYKVSITRVEMRQALADDGFGLNELIDLAVSSVTNKEAYDEMNIMLESVAIHELCHGFYKHQISAAPTDKATGEELLEAIKRYTKKFAFPSTLYNAQDIDGVPTFAKASECVLFVTPEVSAALDVFTLSELFHLDKASITARIIEVPEFPIANMQALLTTEDIFMCARSEYGIYPFFDPNTLTTHNTLHAQGLYSINPFAPAVLFTTDEATVTPVITMKAEGLTLTVEQTAQRAGGTVQLSVALTGTASDDRIALAPNAATYKLTAEDDLGEGVPLSNKTYVDREGVLHIQKTGLKSGNKIKIKATSTYINPSGDTPELTAESEIEIL